jgi:SAM-dependent methyltransferase
MSARAYAEDLAHIHDTGYRRFAERSTPWLLARLAKHRRVVDLGCGSGIFARRLVRAGHEVVGIDQSAAMLALARRAAPGAIFVRGSFVDAHLGRPDAITALGEVLNFRFDARAPLERVIGRVRAALRPGGLFIFDVESPGRGDGRDFRLGPDWATLVERRVRARRMTRRIVTFRKLGAAWRRAEEVHELVLHDPDDVLRVLRRSGFRARVLRGYGALRFPPTVRGFIATAVGEPPSR